MKDLKKHAIFGVLAVVGITLFLALCGEVEGTAGKIILTKVSLALGLALVAYIGKVLAKHNQLPKFDEK